MERRLKYNERLLQEEEGTPQDKNLDFTGRQLSGFLGTYDSHWTKNKDMIQNCNICNKDLLMPPYTKEIIYN
jgi:hypothetical protein